MRLSDLIAYAEEKFNITEQRKWETFSGFSVLADNRTNNRLAVLMREWNPDTGEEIEFCDMKCGRDNILINSVPYLSAPFRVRGSNWIGIRFDETTDEETVYRLFDKAVEINGQTGFMITLDNNRVSEPKYRDTPLKFGNKPGFKEENIPQRILDMQKLYEYGDGSFRQKVKNFRRQAKFMEDYEDDMPWKGDFHHYFPTYHDLNYRQLRGYFSWRTEVRKGNYNKISDSVVYIYLYELINGIGMTSVTDSLNRMKEFEVKYVDSGFGDENLRKNIRKWMLELAVINGIEPDVTRKYADVKMLENDSALAVLGSPQGQSDEDIFRALCVFAGKLSASVVIKKHKSEGIHLFAGVWKSVSEEYRKKGYNLFEVCFGKQYSYKWSPLLNAVYINEQRSETVTYELNECREYSCVKGSWSEKAYQKLYFNRMKFEGLIRETDRQLRDYLRTGYSLGKKNSDAWAVPYVSAVIEQDKREKEEAARPKITIQFDNLDRIRRDASETMESLLTEEERQELEKGKQATEEREQLPERSEQITEDRWFPGDKNHETVADENYNNLGEPYNLKLNETETRILSLLLADKPVQELIKETRSLPEVIADRLNETFYDEIGDTVVECDAETIILVPEYKEDISRIVEGAKNERNK